MHLKALFKTAQCAHITIARWRNRHSKRYRNDL